jgi:hypothetical protein
VPPLVLACPLGVRGRRPPASRLLLIANATALPVGLDPGDLCDDPWTQETAGRLCLAHPGPGAPQNEHPLPMITTTEVSTV